MLVVIAIIGVLAALLMHLLPRANDMKVRARVKAELALVEMAIEHYKEKKGFYPPDNANDSSLNSLYYELSGTTLTNGIFTTLDGSTTILAASVPAAFGNTVTGFINCNEDAKNFLPTIKANQVRTSGTTKFLSIDVRGPNGVPCPWHYNSSSPTHNPNGFDLWVEVLLNNQTNIFGNWKKD